MLQSGKFMSLETLLDDSEFPECRHLVTCCAAEHLSNVSDIRRNDWYCYFTFAMLTHQTLHLS